MSLESAIVSLSSYRLRDWRQAALLIAVLGWVTGFWWCRGRWEHGLWLQWILLPAFACNADRVWELWKAWFREKPPLLVAILCLVEWQLWITGLRVGEWWNTAGSAKDFAVLVVLGSSLILFSQDLRSKEVLWRSVFGIGTLGALVSLFIFYQGYEFSEQRFRLVWRYAPGFNAVTTGILLGFSLVAGLSQVDAGKPQKQVLKLVAVFILSFGVAASESRGALLSTFAGVAALAFTKRNWKALGVNLTTMLAAFVSYFGLVKIFAGDSVELVARGSAGRIDIYRHYLSDLTPMDWLVGKGTVPLLPENVMGWVVHHPHSAYLGQLVGYGIPSLLLLFGILGVALWRLRRETEFSLLVFGSVAILFDGGLTFSAFSMARWEILVVGVPLFVGLAFARPKKQAEDSTKSPKPI